MKSITKLLLAMVAIFSLQTAFAQKDKHKSDWKEMKAFHSVMSKTFHPSEKGDLQPVKDNAMDLLLKAKEWQASAIPADYDQEATKKVLVTLVLKCEELNKAVVDKRADIDLKKLITEAHDIFHEIMEKCRK